MCTELHPGEGSLLPHSQVVSFSFCVCDYALSGPQMLFALPAIFFQTLGVWRANKYITVASGIMRSEGVNRPREERRLLRSQFLVLLSPISCEERCALAIIVAGQTRCRRIRHPGSLAERTHVHSTAPENDLKSSASHAEKSDLLLQFISKEVGRREALLVSVILCQVL